MRIDVVEVLELCQVTFTVEENLLVGRKMSVFLFTVCIFK